MNKWGTLLVTSLVAAGCTETPTAPELRLRAAPDAAPVTAQDATVSAKVVAKSKDPIEMLVREGDGEYLTVVGTFDANLSSRDTRATGWIRTEWGTSPGSRDTGVVVEIRIRDASVPGPDVVLFSGIGTRTDRATGRIVEFPISGSARQDATVPDCVIFDLVGGGVHSGIAEVQGRFDVRL